MKARDSGGSRLSQTATQEQIVGEMAELHDMLQKYEYLVACGRSLETPDPSLRRDEHRIAGCQVSVWMRSELRNGLLHIEADSEAMITRGIISLLLRVLDCRTPAEILEGDLFFLERTGLGSHLSPARANGLAAMVRHIRRCAEEATGLP
jgi:cysteine desulfuration protein SufE